jgi:glycosyltransferase involved in cell wall biosynthesis
MTDKRLSIITVNRNNAGGLASTISSVVSQSFTDFEFIIIDGASQDESPEIIRKNEGHLSYWISEPDKGTYHAMNKGIKMAKGEYCLFLNSGDFLVHPTVLDKIFSHDIQADIISGDVLKIRPNNKFRRVSSPGTVSLHKLCIHSLPHQATLIRRSLFEEISYYNENYRIVSDWEFFLKAIVIHEKSYMHIDEDVSYFRIGGISSSKENFELAYEESQDCLKRLFPKFFNDLMEYRYFYNSNFGQFVLLLKKKKKLFAFVDNLCGWLLTGKKKIAGK